MQEQDTDYLFNHDVSALFASMPRRSTPRKLVVDAAFPVRVKIRVPPDGLGLLLDECFNGVLRWLRWVGTMPEGMVGKGPLKS